MTPARDERKTRRSETDMDLELEKKAEKQRLEVDDIKQQIILVILNYIRNIS